jgi:hypothetical protein
MTTTETEVSEGELVPYEEPTPATIFRTSDPATALERMTEVSKLLFTVVEDRKLYALISGRKHLLVSAWTTLGAMLGLFPVVAWTRPNETGDGYIARVEVLTRAGQLLGAAEAECSRAERAWKNRDPFAIRSMASTRATSRALRGPLEQVVVLAGYEAAGAEEMPTEEPASAQSTTSPAAPVEATAEQRAEIKRLIGRLTELRPETDWKQRAREVTGGPPRLMAVTIANVLIEKLEQSVEAAETFDEGGAGPNQ